MECRRAAGGVAQNIGVEEQFVLVTEIFSFPYVGKMKTAYFVWESPRSTYQTAFVPCRECDTQLTAHLGAVEELLIGSVANSKHSRPRQDTI